MPLLDTVTRSVPAASGTRKASGALCFWMMPGEDTLWKHIATSGSQWDTRERERGDALSEDVKKLVDVVRGWAQKATDKWMSV